MGKLEEQAIKHLALSDGFRRLVGLTDKSLRPRLDWGSLVRLCVSQRVAPIAYHNLKRLQAGGLSIPARAIELLNTAYHLSLAKNVLLFHELVPVLKEFDREGVEAVLLKGSDLALHVYPSLALRALGDVDLLLPKHQIRRATVLMRSLGYKLAPGVYSVPDEDNERLGCEWAFYKGDCVIELHWDIVDSFMPFAVDPADLRRGLRSVRVRETTAAALAPEALILHLALHQYKHGWPNLRGVADVHEVVRAFGDSIDWLDLSRLATIARAERVVYHTLLLCAGLFGTRPPEDFMRRLKGSAGVGLLWHRWQAAAQSVRRFGRWGQVHQLMTRRPTNRLPV